MNTDLSCHLVNLGGTSFSFMISDFKEKDTANTINCFLKRNGKWVFSHVKVKFVPGTKEVISKNTSHINKEDISKIINGIDFQKPIQAICHKNTCGKLDESFWKEYLNQNMFVI
jgi:hypothetical protein